MSSTGHFSGTNKVEKDIGYLPGVVAELSRCSDVAVATTLNRVALFFAGRGVFRSFTVPSNLVSTYSFTPSQWRNLYLAA
jgi:hypothetical protein